MARFESGVSSYVIGTATVTVYFPVDSKGVPDISCYQCDYFRRQSSTCGINSKPCAYPSKFVGEWCPLGPKEGEDNV